MFNIMKNADLTTAAGKGKASPRYFYIGMAIFLIIIVILGFGSTYGYQLVMDQEISGAGVVETDWVIHIHAAVFVGWMILLLMQAVFVAIDEISNHMAIGKTVGIGLAVAVLIAGSLITYVSIQTAIREGLVTWAEWATILLDTMQSWFGLVLFAGLFGLGLRFRDQPQAHKRYMMFATIMLVFAATSRMGYLLGPWHNAIGMGMMVVPLLTYDLYSLTRIHSATLIGTGSAVIYYFVEYFFG